VAGCCECGDEPLGSCATELVSISVGYIACENTVVNVLQWLFWHPLLGQITCCMNAAIHQPLVSMHYAIKTQPFPTTDREASPLPWKRNSEN
jgi:hypothetical protein